uniref:DNA primase n=1 Tax=Pithovirus LCPAC403 TaxID=2506596 RepID=A0A481ZAK7_9VIRU|nr:MAG: DNA primase [Pithovirus LCPAC403]
MSSRSIHDKHWCYKLYRGNVTPGLFGKSPFNTEGIVISLTSHDGYRLFTEFHSHIELFKYTIKFKPERRCFYEVISGNSMQKMKFDIDIKGKDSKFSARILNNLLESVNKVYFNTFNIRLDGKKDILIYQSHGEEKFSYHVIIDNYCLSNAKECEDICVKTCEQMESKYSKYVDLSVYKSTQQLRLLWSHKAKSNRTKFLMNTFEFKGETITRKYDSLLDMFADSLISWTYSCVIISSGVEIITNRFSIEEVTEDDSNLAYSIFLKTLKCDRPFKIEKIMGNLILLKRLLPSYCDICLRIHESENPYLIIKNGSIYFDCRRSDGERKFIGDIDQPNDNDVLVFEDEPSECGKYHDVSEWHKEMLSIMTTVESEYGTVKRCFDEKTPKDRFNLLITSGNSISF